MRRTSDRRAFAVVLGALLASCIVALSAVPADAIVVKDPDGRYLGILPRAGVDLDSTPGAIAARRAAGRSTFSPNGNLDFHGGAVIHASAPYEIFWDPGGVLTATDRNLITRYMTDVAHDSGQATNVFAVDRQFTDSSGFVDYKVTFDPATQVIVDTHPYPARDTTGCPNVNATFFPQCLTDAQLQTEITRLISADSLPSGITGAAPYYQLLTPPNTNICDQASPGTCADNTFCAFHSSFVDGSTTVLYAADPMFYNGASGAQNPKSCQFDGHSAVQSPNGDALADVALKYISHEYNETITDPVNGGGWWNSNSGQENGDQCNSFGSFNPSSGTNPNAFGPTLGGTAGAGTLFDQLINGNPYYTQTEWSNGEINCEAEGVAQTLTPAFSAPAGPNAVNAVIGFDPTASVIGAGDKYTSETWNFGDGSPASFTPFTTPSATLHPASHSFAARGSYTVTLKVVDSSGNLATITHQVPIGTPPVAAFSAPASGVRTVPVSFDASGTTDPDGAPITSYQWNFGDGSAGSGIGTTHAYAANGSYTVTLTVTDSDGLTNTVSHQIAVHTPPTAAFTPPSGGIVGTAVSFISQTTAGDGTLASYAWDFGDGTSGSGASTSHVYSTVGSFTVTLTVTDSNNLTSSISDTVRILTPPVAAFSAPASGVRTVPVSFDASGTTDPDGAPITSYQWNFGDGSAGSGIGTTHAYAANGSYTVTLTVTDSDGLTNTVSHQIAVHTPPTAAFTPPSGGIVGTAVSFISQTTAGDGTLASYAWDFGDGTSGSGASTSHVYSTVGSFTVTLTVTDSNNLTSSISDTVRIGRKPTAVLRVLTKQPFAGAATAFDGSGSSDPGSTISRWAWSFGDGGAGSGASTSHTYKKAGSYLVLLTVSDVDGASSAVSTTVKVIADTITKVKADHGRSIKITVSGPGTLTIGKHKIEVKSAASVTVKLALTNAQAHTLATHHKLNLRLKITFVPAGGGGRVIETVHITLHP